MSTNTGAPTTVWSGIPAGGAGPATANLGVFISGANGTAGFSGTDATNVTIQFTLQQTVSPNKFVNVNLVLDTLKLTVQNAVSWGLPRERPRSAAGQPADWAAALWLDRPVTSASIWIGRRTWHFNTNLRRTVAAVAVGAPSATYATAYKITQRFQVLPPARPPPRPSPSPARDSPIPAAYPFKREPQRWQWPRSRRLEVPTLSLRP